MKLDSAAIAKSLVCASAMVALPCLAQKAGDNIVYLGFAQLVPSSSLGPITNTSPVVTGSGATNGTTATVQSTSTTVFTLLHMFTDNLGAELTLGVPPTMKSDITAPNAGVLGLNAAPMSGAISQTVSFPSLVAKYLFNSPGDALRPYLGLGVNYTEFSSIQPNMSYSTVAAFANGGAGLSSSWNPVYSAGLIYNINDRWSINAAVAYLPLSTNVTLTSNGPIANVATAKLTINPTDYTIKVGYKF